MKINSMMKMMVASAVCVFAFMGIANAEMMRANVPFEFRVGETVLPAGEYLVNVNTMEQRITLQTPEGQTEAFLFGGKTNWPANEGAGVLVFNRYGNTHFLSALKAPSGSVAYKMGKSKAEREMAKAQNGQQVAVGAGGKTPRS
jgi:hypothetical protein